MRLASARASAGAGSRTPFRAESAIDLVGEEAWRARGVARRNSSIASRESARGQREKRRTEHDPA